MARRSLVALTATAALVLGACRQEPVAGPEIAARTRAGAWRFSSDKYSDAGRKPSTGRSGSAAIVAEVLVDAAGRATLEASSHRFDDLATPLGSMERVQAKVLGPGGRVIAVINVATAGSQVSVALGEIPAGAEVQVQALVRGIDGRRTDVVLVSGMTPTMRPDVAVTGIIAPQHAIAGAPTVIGAVLAELGGQRGARVNCQLFVDGVLADQALNIWVDAGDAVSCAFTRAFVPGTAQLRVVAASVRPGDGDPSNNAAAQAMTVVAAQAAGLTSLSGDVFSGTYASADTFETRWTAPDGTLFLEQRNHSVTNGSIQAVNLSATVTRDLPFPLTSVELSENADGRLVRTTRLTDVQPTTVMPGASCYTDDTGSGVALYLCAHQGGFTTISFLRNAGTVTYHSTEYSKIWNGATYDENTYVVNDVSGGADVPMTTHYAVNVKLVAAGTLYAFDAQAALEPFVFNDVAPRQCTTSNVSVPPVTYSASTCFASALLFGGVMGPLTGEGVVVALP